MASKPLWRTLLSVGLCMFAVIRLAMTCSKSSTSSSYNDESYLRLTRDLQEGRNRQNRILESASNNLFYESYDSIERLSNTERDLYQLHKTAEDTLLPLDLSAKIKIEKNSFIQKNYDDTLKTAIKLPDDTSIFLHSFSGNGDLIENFKAVKKNKQIKNISFKLDKPETKYISYRYKQNNRNYNGWALITTENNHFTFIEFENSRIPKNEMETKTLSFISQIIK